MKLSSGAIFLGIGFGYLLYIFYYFLLPIFLKVKVQDKELSTETGDQATEDSIAFKSYRGRRSSYKKNNLEIKIPTNDDYLVLTQKDFTTNYFKENCFPLSQRFLEPHSSKFLKSAKWFLTICFEITCNIVILANYESVQARKDIYIFCPLISLMISLVFSSILALLFAKVIAIQRNSRLLSIATTVFAVAFWLTCFGINVAMNVLYI